MRPLPLLLLSAWCLGASCDRGVDLGIVTLHHCPAEWSDSGPMLRAHAGAVADVMGRDTGEAVDALRGWHVWCQPTMPGLSMCGDRVAACTSMNQPWPGYAHTRAYDGTHLHRLMLRDEATHVILHAMTGRSDPEHEIYPPAWDLAWDTSQDDPEPR